jgi:nitroreductase
MEFDDVLKRRYSCRSYMNKEVNDKILLRILTNAVLAPNSGNLQAWRFIIVKDENKREEIAVACIDQKWMTQAPVHIIILEDLNYVKLHYKKRAELYCIQDSSLAAGNIMLTAASLNLDTCFVSAFDESMLNRILKIPEGLMPYCVITLGYSKDKAENKKRSSLDNMVFFESYGNKSDKNIFPLSKLKSKLIKHTK